uniref:HPS4 biosis of lysosomal organelles complex 3 subunit 2 n=1 Tax=Leptobrachium leishanense TaxID=445787 RepID=A0A8C5LQQ4_9ANUR
MASTDCVQHRSSTWLSYFLLYDASKVKGECDLTRDGIKYFHPPQPQERGGSEAALSNRIRGERLEPPCRDTRETDIDQQELLCGQVAGVVRCMTEIISSPPTLIRLRKLKFAIRIHGDFLWALGCSMEVTDISCKKYLDDLIGLFRFYNGPLWRAYKVHPHQELSDDWRIYLEYLQRITTDLSRIFHSLNHVDKTKVDPLLLLKATLILQTCQRFPHVFAGCILYNDRVVSTQLPPPLTSKILVERIYAYRRPPSLLNNFSDDPVLPDGVRLLEVFVKEQDAKSLCQYPVQWTTRVSSDVSGITSSMSPELEIHPSQSVSESTLEKENENTAIPQIKVQGNAEGTGAPVTSEDLDVGGIATDMALHIPTSGVPVHSSSPVKVLNRHDLMVDQGRITRTSPEIRSTDIHEAGISLPSTGSVVACVSTFEMDKQSFDSESSTSEDSQVSFRHQPVEACPSISTPVPVEEHAKGVHHSEVIQRTENIGALGDHTEGYLELRSNNTDNSVVFSESTDLNLSIKSSTDTDWTLTLDSSPPVSSSKLVKLTLYVHNVKGLVLSLLAGMHFKYEKGLVQDVYDGTLAALNGLEVHLKETMPPNSHNSVTKTAYSFTHYDFIQNILTVLPHLLEDDHSANLPSSSSAHDLLFLRAASLINTDFNLYPSLKEITVRNASSALYACQSTVHQTYFQQLAPPNRNSGYPDPQDSAFHLPSKAKQKLLKHGFNLL